MPKPLSTLDLVLLVMSMVLSALIGLYFTNKNKSIQAYMLGDRKQSLIPVAISLMTSCTSSLTLLGSSAELYYQGITYGLIFLAILLSGPITAYTILPVFYRMNELSLYQYLGRRYGMLVKYFVTVIFVLQMIFYNSVVLYLPAMALQMLFNISKFYSILIIGLMCVLYSGAGGLKAVVWTDFFQALMMYASVIVVGYTGTREAGGFYQVYQNALNGGRLETEELFHFDLTTRHTLLGILAGSTIKHVYMVGVNQVQIQRALSLPTLRMGQFSFIFCSFFVALISLLSTYMGFVLYSAYQSCDPYLGKQISRRDAIIVHYVANRLSVVPGLRGLFVAGIFSATLSSLSSFANSMSALALEDFVKPLRRKLNPKNPEMSESCRTWLAKGMASAFGLVCVLMAYVIDKANSRLLQATTTMFGAVGVPFLASFALGIYTRFTNSLGLFCGFAVTLTLGTYITIYQTFYMAPLEPTQFLYYNDQCAAVFNMTMSPKLLGPVTQKEEAYSQHHLSMELPAIKPPFSIGRISYMTLPVIQFVLTILVSSVVSLLTGGWNQQVDESCLADLLNPNINKQNNINTSKSSEVLPVSGLDDGLNDSQHSLGFKELATINGGDQLDSVIVRKRKLPIIASAGFNKEQLKKDDSLD